MLSKSFKAAKCRTALKLALARIKLLKNRKEVQLKQMKKDLAKLLEVGQDHAARIQVESVFREEKTKAAYEFVEVYCESVTRGLPIIESQKSCPIQLKEAVSSVIFASARCADIPELQDVCKQFVAKYGKEFVTSALELRPDSGVNHLIIEKLSSKNPDAETKIKILRMVAQECNVKWDPASYREQVLKPSVVDLLNERPNFLNASTLHMESPDVHSKPPPSQKSEPATKSFNGDVLQLSPSSQMSASSNSSTPASMPMASLATERKGVERIRHSFLKDGTISVRRNNWSMEFKDATSAAQVAAECAEMASVAARTAAELSSRGYFAGQSSTESSESCFHGPSNEGRRGSNSLKLIADSIEDVSPRSSAWLKSKAQSPQSNRMAQDQQSGSADSRDSRLGSIRRSNMSVSSHSTITSIDKDTLDGFSQGKSSESSERIIKTKVSSQSDDLFPIRYDESEDLTSESEDENFNFRGRSAYHSLSHKPNVSARSLSSARKGDGLAETAVSGKVKVEVVRRNSGSYDFSNEELNVLGNSWKRYGTGYPPTNLIFSGHVESPRQSNDFDVEPSYISISEEERDLNSSRTPSAKDAETNNSLTPQSPATTKSSEISDCLIDENRSILNLRRFTGGLRNKAFSQQPYTRVHSADFSSSSKHEFVDKTSSKSEKNTIFTQEKSSMSHVVHNYKPYNQAPSIRVDEELSANLKTPFNFDTEIADKVRPCQNVHSNGHRGGTLYGRSSDFPSQSNMGITSEVSNSSVCGDRSRLPQEISYSSAAPLSKPLFQAANDRSRVNSLSLHPDSLVEQPSNSHRQIGSSAVKEGGKLTQSNSAVENRPKTIQKANTLGSVEGSKALGASGWSTSRENSIKIPSHVHPKLPDYDTLVAHFKALRSNRRSL